MVMMGSCRYGSSISRDILEFLYRITIKEILELVNNCLIGSRTNHPGTNHHDRLMRVVEEEIDALFADLVEKLHDEDDWNIIG